MADPYIGREQTRAKHFILKRYLQALAFKVLTFTDITYVDGFSGPWRTETEDFADSSFMIAISVLRDAQQRIFERDGVRRRIRCFFSEAEREAYQQLSTAVTPHNRPAERFEIKTFSGRFEEAVTEIQTYIGRSFPLIFIDPTGWTGYDSVQYTGEVNEDGIEIEGRWTVRSNWSGTFLMIRSSGPPVASVAERSEEVER